jgi:glycerol-3-phosphate acyltransferase PlsY
MNADMVIAIVQAVGIGYLLGAMPWGLWLGRWIRNVDVREHGSRNLGATNVYRVLGPGLGITTLVLDVLKGAIPVWLVPALPVMDWFPGGREWCAVLVGLSAVLGHIFTCFAGFRGGKGVATTAGVLLALAPQAFLVFALVFVITVAVTRYVSLGSTLGAIAFCVMLLWSTGGAMSPTFLLGLLLALLVIARHRDNFGRLWRGEERRFSFRRGGGSAPDSAPAGAPREDVPR